MITSVLSRPVFFKRPVVTVPRQLVRSRNSRSSKVVKLCYTDVAEEAEQVYVEEDAQKVIEREEKAEQERLNRVFRKIDNPTNFLLSLESEEPTMNFVNAYTAAKTLQSLTVAYSKEYALQGKPEEMLETQSKLVECYLALFPILEKHIPNYTPRAVSDTVKSLNTAAQNLGLDKKHDQAFQNVLSLVLQHAVEIKEELIKSELTRVVYVASFYYEQNKAAVDELVKQAMGLDVQGFDRYDAQDMVQILKNTETYDPEYFDSFFEVSMQKFFRDKNRLFCIKFVESITQLGVKKPELIEKVTNFLEKKVTMSGLTLRIFAQFAAQMANQEEKDRLIDGIMGMVEAKGASYWVEDLVEILYYVASMKVSQEKIELVKNTLLQKLDGDFESLSTEQVRFLQQTQIFCHLQNFNIDFPQQLLDLFEQDKMEYIQEKISQYKDNSFVTEVFDVVQGRFPEAECGAVVSTVDGSTTGAMEGISDKFAVVPIMLKNAGVEYLIEPLSKDQFVKNENQELLGVKQTELDVLSQMGYQVVPVSELKWNDMSYQEEILQSF
eukprot:TRINITY_DN10767_c0_g3_i3.p1 TRINITY_DN10767_c0_g3~~TRINITY_DN10767_c0_g3_i3.p1  ORF type:complete len:552 (-),score=100.69 TRINITY_DN10767_c0_g3_i3:265-1920(-)